MVSSSVRLRTKPATKFQDRPGWHTSCSVVYLGQDEALVADIQVAVVVGTQAAAVDTLAVVVADIQEPRLVGVGTQAAASAGAAVVDSRMVDLS